MKTRAGQTIGARAVAPILCVFSAGVLCAQQQASGGPTIPAISGTVVDAVTGTPLAGIDVTLRVTATEHKWLRYENRLTQRDGRFRFAPLTVAPLGGGWTVSGIEEISITVNIPFVSRERARAEGREEEDGWMGTGDASTDLLRDPLYNIKVSYVGNLSLRGSRINNKAYFPEAVQFLKGCAQLWNANCLSMDVTRNVRVPLIPVMDDASGCRRIADPALSEGCRQLQTYRAAFRHVETIAEVRADKELCNSLDHASMSATCMERLHFYVQSASFYDSRPPLRMEIDPPEKALILTPIAGMTALLPRITGEDPFWARAYYSVGYRHQSPGAHLEAARVSVALMGDPDQMQMTLAVLFRTQPGGSGATKHTEIFYGSPVTVVDSDNDSDVIWRSSERIVTIAFPRYLRGGVGEQDWRESVATPEIRRELILEYLAKYPVTN